MARYERKDYYYQKAKAEGRASRASYKIEEIQEKYDLIHPGDTVVDLGCAPGGWLQVLSRLVGPTGHVIGIDQVPVTLSLPPNVRVIEADLTATKDPVSAADVVVSDMAPHTTGVKFGDGYRSYELAEIAWEYARHILKPGGHFVTKIFDGPDVATLRHRLHTSFARVDTFTPRASRDGSRELYLVGMTWQKKGR